MHTDKLVVICKIDRNCEPFSHKNKCGHMLADKSVVSYHTYKIVVVYHTFGFLHTTIGVIFCPHPVMWSSAHRQKCGFLHK